MVQHIILITGPAGSGKTTTATKLAAHYGLPFLEGDSFHPAANIDKMASGHALTDEDRWEWLARVRDGAVAALQVGPDHVAPALVPAAAAAHGRCSDVRGQQAGVVDPASTSTSTSTSMAGAAAAAASSTPVAVAPEAAAPPAASAPSNGTPRAIVVTCSALKRSYRDVLRSANTERRGGQDLRVTFVFLSLSEEVLVARVKQRTGHFMKQEMVHSQIEVLEPPLADETGTDTIVVDAGGSRDVVELEVERAVGLVLEAV